MDVVEKFIATHQGIREQKDVLEKLARAVDNDAFFWDSAVKISAFFNTEVQQHVEMEEKVLFPVLRKVLPADKLAALDEIEKEHGPLREKLAYFEGVSTSHNRFPSKVTRGEMVKAVKDLLAVLLEHAQREDDDIFPFIERSFRPEHFKELERRYFEFIGA